jgi:GDP-4-dehydro-6-deoxy-D-mannose reductase
MSSTTIVTGAAGFAGGHLLDLLAADAATGDTIVAWRRPRAGSGSAPGRTDPLGAGAIRWEDVDLLDRDAVRAAVARTRPSMVYHCAGEAHVGQAWNRTETTFATNVRGTHYLLDALSRVDADSRVLIPSSALVYTPADRPLREDDARVPDTPYGLSKLAQEMLAEHAGPRVTVTIARAFNHIGPRQDPMFAASGFARRIADIERGRWEPTITVGNLDSRRDLTDVRDTVRAYQLILTRGAQGDVFNVCSGVAFVIRDLLDHLIGRARVPVRIQVDPARYRPNDAPLLVGNPGRIRDRLGWATRIAMDRTIDDLLEYWRGQA